MVLVDTSIWVEHLRKGDVHLERLLLDGEVACHSFIIGELACGNLRNRAEILSLLQALPETPSITQAEYLYFVEQHHLFGRGIGFVDVHLLASAKLSGIPLWTGDRKLREATVGLGLAYLPEAARV